MPKFEYLDHVTLAIIDITRMDSPNFLDKLSEYNPMTDNAVVNIIVTGNLMEQELILINKEWQEIFKMLTASNEEFSIRVNTEYAKSVFSGDAISATETP